MFGTTNFEDKMEFQVCVTLQMFSEAPVGITVADIFMISKSSILTVSLKKRTQIRTVIIKKFQLCVAKWITTLP